MTDRTDPARELAEICDRLNVDSKRPGAEFLALKFEVEPWSREFYQIIFCILERADFLMRVLGAVDYDEDFRAEAIRHIEDMKLAFSQSSFGNAWNQVGIKKVGPLNAQPLKMLSPAVRREVAYPKLSAEEISEILAETEQLESWLAEQQLAEHDFIRQAILDGLAHFKFRMLRLNWLGWGYATESLREVTAAYFALERTGPTAAHSPNAEAVLRKVEETMKSVFKKTKVVTDVVSAGDIMLRGYGALMLTWQSGQIAGLLPHLS